MINSKRRNSRPRKEKRPIFTKRNGIIAAFALTGVVFFIPTIVSFVAKSTVENFYEAIAEESGLKVEKVDEDGGWRSGYVTYQFSVADPQVAEYFPYTFELTNTMRYGPFISSLTGKWVLFDADIDPYFEGERLFTGSAPPARIEKNLNGEGNFVIDIKRQDWYLPSMMNIELGSFFFLVDLSNDTPDTTVRYEIEDFLFYDPNISFSIGFLQATNNLKEIAGFYVGDGVSTLKNMRLRITEPRQDILIREIEGISNSDVDNQLLSSFAHTTVSQMVVNNDKVGPIEMSMSLGNLSMKDLVQFQEMALEFEEKYGHSPAVYSKKMDQLISSMGYEILKPNPYIEFNIDSLKLPEGEMSAHWRLSIANVENDDFKNPFDLIPKLMMELDLSADRNLVEYWLSQGLDISAAANAIYPEAQGLPLAQVPAVPALDPQSVDATLSSAIEYNWAVEEGDTLKTSLRFEKGQLLFNGDDLPLPLFGFQAPAPQ